MLFLISNFQTQLDGENTYHNASCSWIVLNVVSNTGDLSLNFNLTSFGAIGW